MYNTKYIGYENMIDLMTFISVNRKGKDQKDFSDSFRFFKILYCQERRRTQQR